MSPFRHSSSFDSTFSKCSNKWLNLKKVFEVKIGANQKNGGSVMFMNRYQNVNLPKIGQFKGYQLLT